MGGDSCHSHQPVGARGCTGSFPVDIAREREFGWGDTWGEGSLSVHCSSLWPAADMCAHILLHTLKALGALARESRSGSKVGNASLGALRLSRQRVALAATGGSGSVCAHLKKGDLWGVTDDMFPGKGVLGQVGLGTSLDSRVSLSQD